jgi:hypothetical protein
MSSIIPPAATDEAREHTITVTGTAATGPPGRTGYQGSASPWPTRGGERPDPKDRAIARWLDVVETIVFYRACGSPASTTRPSPPAQLPASGSSAGETAAM